MGEREVDLGRALDPEADEPGVDVAQGDREQRGKALAAVGRVATGGFRIQSPRSVRGMEELTNRRLVSTVGSGEA